MKKFTKFFAVITMAVCAVAACDSKEEPTGNGNDNGNGNNNGIIDDSGTNNTGLPASLQGSDYIVFFLGEDEYSVIEKKVSVNLMPNNANVFVDVWPAGQTYEGGTAAGLNSYGFGEGWLCFSATGYEGWSGGAIACRPSEDGSVALPVADLSKIMTNPSEWYFHVALKSDVPGQSHVVGLNWAGAEFQMILGANPGDYTGDATYYPTPVSGTYQVGEWNEYEIPLSMTGLKFNSPIAAGNLVSFLSGGTVGKTLNLDAIFIYKK